jgi:hypothetical protein
MEQFENIGKGRTVERGYYERKKVSRDCQVCHSKRDRVRGFL